MSELARKQADLVAAVTGTGPPPKGFDALRLDAARVALLRKRSRAVAAHWPGVAGDLGADLPALFASWAATRPTQGSQVDGHAFARAHRSRLVRQAWPNWPQQRPSGTSQPRRRRLDEDW